MNNIVAIDLQALCCPDKSGVDTNLLSNVLQGIHSIKHSSLLFREEVYSLFDYQDPFISTNIWALLSDVDFELYDAECLCRGLTTKPDISKNCADAMKEEITLQCSFFHRNGIHLFLGFHPMILGMNNRPKICSNKPMRIIKVKNVFLNIFTLGIAMQACMSSSITVVKMNIMDMI